MGPWSWGSHHSYHDDADCPGTYSDLLPAVEPDSGGDGFGEREILSITRESLLEILVFRRGRSEKEGWFEWVAWCGVGIVAVWPVSADVPLQVLQNE